MRERPYPPKSVPGLIAAAGLCATLAIPYPAIADETKPEIGRTLSGNYLAGRHAQAQRDLSRAADFLGAALDKAPSSPDLIRRTFVLMVAEGRVKEAGPLASKLVQMGNKVPMAPLTLAIIDIRNGRFVEADKRLGDLPATGLVGFVAPVLRAWCLAGQNKSRKAMKILKAPVDHDAKRVLHTMHAALISELLGNNEDAEKFYTSIHNGQTELSLRMAQLLGALYERTGRKDKAQALYEKYLGQNPGSQLLDGALKRLKSGGGPTLKTFSISEGAAEVLFGIASSLRQKNGQQTALMLGRLALYLKPEFPVMQILLGDVLETANRLEPALELYQSIRRNSAFSWPARLRVAVLLGRLNRHEDAIRHLDAMAGDQPEDPGPLINMGDILRGQERFEEAVEAYDRAFERIRTLKPHHWTLLYARGIALERSKQWPRAEADFLSALKFKPDQPYVLNYLGYSWIDKGLYLDRAQAMIGKAANLRPNDGYVIDSLGWGHYKLGKYKKAVLELERAVELRPQDPVINDHLGDAYWRVGRRREARFQWNRSLSLDPEEKLIGEITRKLKSGLESGGSENSAKAKKNRDDG
ncbi:MAG: tetratricopeptide repeat protein [Rhodospirillales bacterium]|nr:tetratricopeptide repeat protein [Alphaproteobacteria bacterium]MBL6948094.1 tetratricopeptide repeat protein [Rhodospirillales bacterium]